MSQDLGSLEYSFYAFIIQELCSFYLSVNFFKKIKSNVEFQWEEGNANYRMTAPQRGHFVCQADQYRLIIFWKLRQIKQQINKCECNRFENKKFILITESEDFSNKMHT